MSEANQRVMFKGDTKTLMISLPNQQVLVQEGGRTVQKWISPGTILFTNFTYITSDPAMIEALRKHKSYGKTFHEVNTKPEVPKPTVVSSMTEQTQHGKEEFGDPSLIRTKNDAIVFLVQNGIDLKDLQKKKIDDLIQLANDRLGVVFPNLKGSQQ